jgi:hypothetical protein
MKNEQTIIQYIGAYSAMPFVMLGTDVIELCNLATRKKSNETVIRPLIRFFENFLRITGQSLSITDLNQPTFSTTCETFLGALNSEKFTNLSRSRRYEYSREFIRLINTLHKLGHTHVKLSLSPSTCNITAKLQNHVHCFEQLGLIEEQVWLCRGWPSQNRVGRTTWFPLFPIYERLGRTFTQEFFELCDSYYSARRSARIVALPQLAGFIGSYQNPLEVTSFKDSLFVTKFWREFYSYYIHEGRSAGVGVELLITNWRNEFLFFVLNYLISSGLFAEPFGALPSPEPKRIGEHRTHIKKIKSGIEVKTKLLTDIPMYVTDDEAMEILFNRIQLDINLVVDWAKFQVSDIWSRVQRRKALSHSGCVRIIGKNGDNTPGTKYIYHRSNPDHLKNAIATFASYGYVTKRDIDINLLFPSPLDQTAYELGLPSTGSLLPHLILLVAQHPSITPSFLENLELYDKDAKRVGFTKTDIGYVLNGHKYRKGPLKAQQIVTLTAETATIVLQIISITNPLRKYLRIKGDDNWRYLLLTSGKAFGYPKRIQRIATDTSQQERVEALARGLAAKNNADFSEMLSFAHRISLPAIRASVGVITYIESKNLRKMANALGHHKYSPKLLARYLPPAILDFFQERWIRIFQTGLIVEALKDSEYLIEASNFNNLKELDQFLKIHALKLPSNNESEITKSNQHDHVAYSEIAIGVSPAILTCLINIHSAVNNATCEVSGTAKYWAEIASGLVEYIENDSSGRSDLKSYLTEARTNSDPNSILPIIYA